MTIWMVTGLHDRRWLDNVAKNVLRQTSVNCRLILVENGNGLGDGLVPGLSNHIYLRSEPGPAQPLNTALDWLLRNAKLGDWFAKCDADDYYGPQYLASIQRAIDSGCDYCGRSSIYIRTMTDRLWYVESQASGYIFHGPTLAARVRTALAFPEVEQWGEDELWCHRMHEQGSRAYCLPPEGFCYQRWSDYRHSWPCTDHELRTSWPKPFRDLGPWDPDIVNGASPRPDGIILEPPECGVDDFMATRVLKEKLPADYRRALTQPTKEEQAMKRRIKAPTNGITINGQEKQYFQFDMFVLWAINGDVRFNQNGQGIRASMRIETALNKLTPVCIDPKPDDPEPETPVMDLKKEDYDLLLESVTSPQQMNGQGYPLSPARSLLPFITAIESAETLED